MSNLPIKAAQLEEVLDVAKYSQLITLVKENQLVTALICFLLWQVGVLSSAQSYASGVMC